jgi:hypothetical protein
MRVLRREATRRSLKLQIEYKHPAEIVSRVIKMGERVFPI